MCAIVCVNACHIILRINLCRPALSVLLRLSWLAHLRNGYYNVKLQIHCETAAGTPQKLVQRMQNQIQIHFDFCSDDAAQSKAVTGAACNSEGS